MKRTILAVVVALFLTGRATHLAASEQQPINGCSAAPSCRSNSFLLLKGNAGGHVLMSFGAAWNPVFHLDLVIPPSPPSGSDEGDHRFHLHAPTLPPPPALAKSLLPAPEPMPLASDSEEREGRTLGH